MKLSGLMFRSRIVKDYLTTMAQSSSLQQLDPSKDFNHAFYSAFFLTFIGSPIVGVIPLCCSDRKQPGYSAYYTKGMAFSTLTSSVILLASSIALIVQSCTQSQTSYSQDLSGYHYDSSTLNHDKCEALSAIFCPLTIISFALSAALWRYSRTLLTNLEIIQIARESQTIPLPTNPIHNSLYVESHQPATTDLLPTPIASPNEPKQTTFLNTTSNTLSASARTLHHPPMPSHITLTSMSWNWSSETSFDN
ncbi:hypothetical protein BCR33DRAFT_498159 [Rhizoclosmatium globosum]|uniref:Uncharacterized protein n=1 Tax=Rhizoclosmatium globosum TaxID=329046 RepID=A0A1Y2CV43_9FUNG|nr:hypothetical protein BCR33DRAFT_498159 [Rhizoclosmatium globosum]|eukprot:ORY50911.1 hypothetical protein BCR33DRAFT_498159 [Rhizoclosmatium globosum]